MGAGRGSPPPAKGVRGYNPREIFDILHAKSCILGDFWMINIHLTMVLVMVVMQSLLENLGEYNVEL